MIKSFSLSFLILLSAVPLHCREDSEFHVARRAYEDGLYQISADQFLQFISSHPDSDKVPAAYFYLGECKFKLGKFHDAVRAYAAASPEFREAAIYKTARARLAAGNYSSALDDFLKYLSEYPEGKFSDSASYRSGECFYNKNDFSRARDAFLRVPEINPASPYRESAMYAAGLCSMKTGDFPGAEETFKKLLAGSPAAKLGHRAHYWLGRALMESGDYAGSRESFTASYSLLPSGAFADAALYQGGVLLFRNGEYEQAAADFARVPELFPESPLGRKSEFMAGRSREELGDLEKAVEYYRMVSEKDRSPLAARALYRKGKCLLASGKKPEAARVFGVLAESYPGTEEYFFASAFKSAAHYGLGQYREAALAVENIRAENMPAPLEPAIFFLYGSARLATGETDKAMESFGRVASGEYSHSWRGRGAFYHALCLFRTERFEEAAEAFSRFASGFPGSELLPHAHFAAGESFYRSGNYVKAERHLREASGEPALRDTALFRMGDSLFDSGEPARAREKYASVGGALSGAAGLKIARILYAEGEMEAVREIARSLAEEESRGADHAQYLLSGSALRLGELEKAEEGFSLLIKKFPGSELVPATFFNLGTIWYRRGDFARANEHFEKVVQLFPEEPEALESRFWSSVCLEKIGRDREAISRLEGYLGDAPRGTHADQARLRLGKHYFEAGELKLAEDMLLPLKASEDTELKTNAAYWTGRVYAEGSKYEDAHGMFSRVITEDKDAKRVVETLMRIGSLYRRQNMDEEAVSVYSRILREYPGEADSAETLYSLGRTLQALGRYPEAVEAFRQIEPSYNEEREADIQLRTADSLSSAGRREEAVLEYLKLAYLFPSQNEMVLRGLESAARILESLGREQEAVKIYRRIAEIDPEGIKGEMATRKLLEITR